MAKRKPDKQKQQSIVDARRLIAAIARQDANEAETRRRIERIFVRVMGYDAFAHLSRERAIHGAGDTEHVDFAIQVDEAPDAAPAVMVEIKRVGMDLTSRHLRQAAGYAIDAGCEWVLLTNARDWQLYHVEFGQPPETKLVERWNLLEDDPEALPAKFDLISYRSVRRGHLTRLWERTEALAPRSLLTAILSPDSLTATRRGLRRETGVAVKADQIVTALRRMLNEAAAVMLEDVVVSLPPKRAPEGRRSRKRGKQVRLKAVLEAGLMKPGTILFVEYRSARHEATVQPDGTVLFEGRSYRSPSAAGGAVTAKHNVHSPNGWRFWEFTDDSGTERRLDDVRKQYLSQAPLTEAEARREQ